MYKVLPPFEKLQVLQTVRKYKNDVDSGTSMHEPMVERLKLSDVYFLLNPVYHEIKEKSKRKG